MTSEHTFHKGCPKHSLLLGLYCLICPCVHHHGRGCFPHIVFRCLNALVLHSNNVPNVSVFCDHGKFHASCTSVSLCTRKVLNCNQKKHGRWVLMYLMWFIKVFFFFLHLFPNFAMEINLPLTYLGTLNVEFGICPYQCG
jgi:hypothetical protein